MQTVKEDFIKVVKESTCKTDILRHYKMLNRSTWLEKELKRHEIYDVKIFFKKRNLFTVQKECECCKKIFYVKDNFRDKQRRFCTKSCANKAEPRRKSKNYNHVCVVCGVTFKGYKAKFCSHNCRAKNIKDNVLERFKKGEVNHRPTIRKCLSQIKGYKCVKCGISNWNNLPITLQVNHIDGNPGNHSPDNVELICPNCHTQTDTFSGRNKGSGRKSRGLPLF